jgi:hypothetical protein
MPAMRYVRPSPRERARVQSFGNVSVVMDAHATTSHAAQPWLSVLDSRPRGHSTGRIWEIRRGWPITPVDIASISEDSDDGGEGARRASVTQAMRARSTEEMQMQMINPMKRMMRRELGQL